MMVELTDEQINQIADALDYEAEDLEYRARPGGLDFEGEEDEVLASAQSNRDLAAHLRSLS